MLASRSIHTGNAGDINTYEQYTAEQLRIYAPHRDINSQLLNNMGFGNRYYNYSYEHLSGEGFQTNTINLNPVRNIYIHSSTLGGYNTLSTGGSRNIIKNIPVNESTGFVIFDRVLHSTDYLDCSGQSLSTIDFRFCNSNGQTIDLKGDQSTFFNYL